MEEERQKLSGSGSTVDTAFCKGERRERYSVGHHLQHSLLDAAKKTGKLERVASAWTVCAVTFRR